MVALQASSILIWLVALVLVPIEVVFWAGFAVPIPPLIAIARLGLLAAGWSALR